MQLVRASTNALELSWASTANADYYMLQIQKLPTPVKEESEEPKAITPLKTMRVVQPPAVQGKIIYSPAQPIASTAEPPAKKPMIIIQPKKTIQLSGATMQTSTAQGSSPMFKVLQSGVGGVGTTQQHTMKVIQKPITPGTIQVQRPTFAGNVIKLMPGTILCGNKIIMKPQMKQDGDKTTMTGQHLTVVSSAGGTIVRSMAPVIRTQTGTVMATSSGQPLKINTMTAQGPRIVTPINVQQSKPITIGGKTVTLQLMPQKKMTLVGSPAGTMRVAGPQKFVMMPSGIVKSAQAVATSQAQLQHQQQQLQHQQQQLQQQQQPNIEQMDGTFDGIDDDDEPLRLRGGAPSPIGPPELDGNLMAQDDDIESQISTVKIEKHTDGESGDGCVKVTKSGHDNDKIEDNEAAAILTTIREQSPLASHSVNTIIPMHDEK